MPTVKTAEPSSWKPDSRKIEHVTSIKVNPPLPYGGELSTENSKLGLQIL